MITAPSHGHFDGRTIALDSRPMLRAQPVVLVLCLVTLSCTTTATTTPGDANELDQAEPAAKPEPEPSPEPSPSAVALPECPSDPLAQGMLTTYCTEQGELAGFWVPVDTLKIPADAEILFDLEAAEAREQPRLLVALRGEELYIRRVACGACRRVTGRGFAGHLSRLSAAQVAAMQGALGLDEGHPLLDSGAKWVSFTSEPGGQQALNEVLSKVSEEPDSGGR